MGEESDGVVSELAEDDSVEPELAENVEHELAEDDSVEPELAESVEHEPAVVDDSVEPVQEMGQDLK